MTRIIQRESNRILKTNESKSTRLSKKIGYLCIFFISIWAISPVFSYGAIYRIFVLFANLIWTVLTYLGKKKIRIDVMLAIIYVFITSIINYLYHGTEGVLRNIQVYIFIFLYIVNRSYEKKDILKLEFMVIPLLILFSIWNTLTVREYSEISNISRMLSKNFEAAEEFAKRGIGGHGLIFSQIILVPTVLYSLRKNIFKQIWKKCFLCYYIIITIILIIKAGISLALINLTITMAIYLVIYKKNYINSLSVLILSFLLLLLIYINFERIFMFLFEITKGTSYNVKVMDIYLSFTNGFAVGTYYDRIERYTRSIILFFKSPVWGQLSYAYIGKHSPILDNFAQYGVLIGGIFLRIILIVPYRFMIIAKDKLFGLTFAVFISVLIYFSTDNISASMGVSLFIIYPTILKLIQEGEKNVT